MLAKAAGFFHANDVTFAEVCGDVEPARLRGVVSVETDEVSAARRVGVACEVCACFR